MQLFFDNLSISMSIPDGTILYKKDEATKFLKFSKSASEHCLMVISDGQSESTTSITHLGDVDTKEEYMEVLEVLLEQNNSMGIKLLERERIEEKDGKALEILKFRNRKSFIVMIFVCIKRHIIMANTNSDEENFEKATKFAKEIMKSISLIKN